MKKDTREIFYVGIGKTEKRAYNKHNRSDFWKRIVNKYDYVVDIVCKDVSWEEAVRLEKFLISIYGREDLGNGILCNMTDGGDGCLGRKNSDETKLKMSKSAKGLQQWLGKKHSLETKCKMGNPCYQYDLSGNLIAEYYSVREAARIMNVDKECIRRVCIGQKKTSCNYKWSYIKNENR